MESRSLTVPDELDGVRVDAALAKLLGFSRTFAADVAESGGVFVDARGVRKSDRVTAGARLDVAWTPREEPKAVAEVVPELGIIFQDEHLVVVDKPVGVAAHPS
ncbi:MAG: RluA family pseudouridine synthase, partial [Microbacterium sp.]